MPLAARTQNGSVARCSRRGLITQRGAERPAHGVPTLSGWPGGWLVVAWAARFTSCASRPCQLIGRVWRRAVCWQRRPDSLDVIGGGHVASGVTGWAGARRGGRPAGTSGSAQGEPSGARRHSRRLAVGTAIPRRTGIGPGRVPRRRAGRGRTRARRWPGVRCGAGRRGPVVSKPRGPPVLAAGADLGECNFAPRLLARPRAACRGRPAGQREPADAPFLCGPAASRAGRRCRGGAGCRERTTSARPRRLRAHSPGVVQSASASASILARRV